MGEGIESGWQGLSAHSLTRFTFSEHLLYSGHCSRPRETTLSKRLTVQWGRQTNGNIISENNSVRWFQELCRKIKREGGGYGGQAAVSSGQSVKVLPKK